MNAAITTSRDAAPLEAGSPRRPNLLHLVHRLPYPPDKGDRIRSFNELRYLSARSNVYLACLADEPIPDGAIPALEHYCQEVAVVRLDRSRWFRALAALASGGTITEAAFWSPRLAQIVCQWSSDCQFHATLASASSMVPYQQLPELRHVPAIVDLVDVDSQKWLDLAAATRPPKRWLYRIESHRLRRLEKSLPTWAHRVLLTTPAEARLYEGFTGTASALVMNNGVDLEYFKPPTASQTDAERPTCVFVGALDYPPNIDGACWFASEVWPRIRQQRPAAKFYVVGRKPVPSVLRLAELPGIEVVGSVPDVRPWLARANVVVAPLRIARGVQNKVLEALAMARAVVVSPTCLTGLNARPGEELLTAATPDEWSAQVLRLFADANLRSHLGLAGRAHVEERHSWERCLSPLGELIDGIQIAALKNGVAR